MGNIQNKTGGALMTKFFRKYSDKMALRKKQKLNSPAVCEVYIDGTLKKAEVIDDNTKSFGIFMHSLILSNTGKSSTIENGSGTVVNESEKAITLFTLNKGFNNKLIEAIAPNFYLGI